MIVIRRLKKLHAHDGKNKKKVKSWGTRLWFSTGYVSKSREQKKQKVKMVSWQYGTGRKRDPLDKRNYERTKQWRTQSHGHPILARKKEKIVAVARRLCIPKRTQSKKAHKSMGSWNYHHKKERKRKWMRSSVYDFMGKSRHRVNWRLGRAEKINKIKTWIKALLQDLHGTKKNTNWRMTEKDKASGLKKV